MLHLAVLLLASSCITLCSHIHRDYYLINMPKSWAEAQSYCRENHTDLATIGTIADMERLTSLTEASGINSEIWIGLRETGAASWLWSLRETQTSHGLAEYTNWFSSPNSSHHCGGMRDDGKWLSALCETTLPFVCQGGSDGLHVVLQAKSWREAQEYCRMNDSDLASVRNQAENQALQQITRENVGVPSLMWMGLFRDEWKWSDQSDSSFRFWDIGQPNDDGTCALYRPSAKKWYDRGCTTEYPFFCHGLVTKRRKSIVTLELESSLDMNDPAVSEAILNQLQLKNKGVKLQWRVQPDGKIFHKKESKKKQRSC